MAKGKARKKKAAPEAEPKVDSRADRMAAAMASAAKHLGSDAVRTGTAAREERAHVPTGSFGLDEALGGGWVRGRVYELFGPESAGKTTLALTAIAGAQRAGGIAAFVDVEHALELDYASTLGVDLDALVVARPADAESALEAIRAFVRQGMDIVVCDTVAALSPRAELAGSMGDAHVGRQARLMSQALRMLASEVRPSGAVLLFLNQLREKVGVTFGNPETTSGGRALAYYSNVRLEVRAGAAIKDDAEVVEGRAVKVTVVKSKTSVPHRRVTFPLLFGRGIWRAAELLEHGLEAGLIDQSGSWFQWRDVRTQGKRALLLALEGCLEEFEADVREAVRGGGDPEQE